MEVKTMQWFFIYTGFAIMFTIILVQETKIHELKQALQRQPEQVPAHKPVAGREIPFTPEEEAIIASCKSSIPEDTATLINSIIGAS